MSVKIEGVPTGKLEEKRLYLPGVTVKSNCPKCGKEVAHSLGWTPPPESVYYLSYPMMNEPTRFVCWCESCDVNWDVQVRLVVKLEVP